jgi:hypothetical protein
MMMIDETDIDLVGSGGSSPSRAIKRSANDLQLGPKQKRKPGPLPKDFSLQRPLSPYTSPPPSPSALSPSPSTSSSPPTLPPIPPPPPPPTPPPLPQQIKDSVKSVTNGNSNLNRTKDTIQPINPITSSESPKPVIIVAKDAPIAALNQNSALTQSLPLSPTKSVSDIQLINHNSKTHESIESNTELTPKSEPISTNNLNNNQNLLVNQNNNNNNNISNNNTNNNISVKSVPTFVPVNGRTDNSDSFESTTQLTNHCDHNGIDNQLNNNSNKRVQFTAEDNELKKYLFKLVKKPGRSMSSSEDYFNLFSF